MRWAGLRTAFATGWLMWSSGLVAAAPLSITLANAEWPPYIGETLPEHGLLSHLVVAAFEREGVQVRQLFVPNNRVLTGVRSGAYDGSYGWTQTVERARDMLFSEPLFTSRFVFYEHRAAPHPWRELGDLKGLNIGVTQGNYHGDVFEGMRAAGVLNVAAASSDVVNFRKLLAGHIDLFADDEVVGRSVLAQLFPGMQSKALAAQNHTLVSFPLYLVISRQNPQAQELIARFNRGLAALKASGAWQGLALEKP